MYGASGSLHALLKQTCTSARVQVLKQMLVVEQRPHELERTQQSHLADADGESFVLFSDGLGC